MNNQKPAIMDGPSRTLYIENFPLNTTSGLIHKLFAHFGPIKGVDLPTFDANHQMCRGLPAPKAKGYAFVEFANPEDAQKACKLFNGLSYILAAASKLLGQSKLTAKIEESLADKAAAASAGTSIALDRDGHSMADLKQTILSNLEYRKLLLIRVMTKHKFQTLAARYNELRLQSQVGAAKMLLIS